MFPYNQAHVEIPTIFHSIEFDGPFQNCQICNRELYHDGQAYMIEKVFRGPETIIEIATCWPCAVEMQGSISAESAQTIQREFHDKVNLLERLEWLGANPEGSDSESDNSESDNSESDNSESSEDLDEDENGNNSPLDSEKWLDSCILSGTPREKARDFQVVGMFMGDKMVLSIFPYLISAKSIEEIGEKLSQETRGFMQDFIDNQFGMPPEFCNPESPLPILI